LDKKSRTSRTFSRYWFVLKADRLSYYEDSQVRFAVRTRSNVL